MTNAVRTAEDIIGVVPHALGYRPRKSLVAIIVTTDGQGRQSTETTMRIDFDLDTAAHLIKEPADWFADLIFRTPNPTGVILVLYDEEYLDGGALLIPPGEAVGRGDPAGGGDPADQDEGLLWANEEFSAKAGPPRVPEEFRETRNWLIRTSIDRIAQALGTRKLDVIGAFWVSADRFGRIDTPDDPGTALSEAESSRCATALIVDGSAPAASVADLLVRPVEDEIWTQARVAEADEWLDIDYSFDVLSAIYPVLTEMRRDTAVRSEERLQPLFTPVLLMALDSIMSETWSRDALEMILSFNHPDFRPVDIHYCPPGALGILARDTAETAEAAQSLVGLSPRAPRPHDARVAIAFLEHYVSWAHPAVRANAYGVLAWFEWSSGGTTKAELYAQMALDEDPEHVMANLLCDAIAYGFGPTWATPSRQQPSAAAE